MSTDTPESTKMKKSRLGRGGQDLVRRQLMEGRTNAYIRVMLAREGYPEVTDSSLTLHRLKPEVREARELAAPFALLPAMAGMATMVRFLNDSIWELIHRTHGTIPDPECAMLVVKGSGRRSQYP